MTRTLIIGLGNPILGDDGVGWRVAEAVQAALPPSPDIEVDCAAVGGLALMERLIGYDRAIVIDAVVAGGPVGAVTCCDLSALPDRAAAHLAAPHDTTLPTAVRLGQQLGARLPRQITIVGVEARALYEFNETLTPEAQAAVPAAARRVLNLLEVPP